MNMQSDHANPMRARATSAPTHKSRRKSRRGQTLIIFVFTLTTLISILGLAIDSVRTFDIYARARRAAEAGALAGVIYMPSNYNTPLTGTPNNDSAVSRASREVVKNGFGHVLSNTDTNVAHYCPANPTTVEIAVCVDPVRSNRLIVTVTEPIDVLMLSAVGVGPSSISASASAEYLPPLALGFDMGSEGSTFGIQTNGKSNDLWSANINGPGELKEQGDPYVYCEEGPSDGPPAEQSRLTSPAPYTTYDGTPTNHPQYYLGGTSAYNQVLNDRCGPPGNTVHGNPDQQLSTAAGPMTSGAGSAHPGAYNYLISVPAGTSNPSVWVYNGNYAPSQDVSCTGRQKSLDEFYWSGCFDYYPYYGAKKFNTYFDDKYFYFNTTFTLYTVNNVNFPLDDTMTGSPMEFLPYDQMPKDTAAHNCTAVDVGNGLGSVNTLNLSSYQNSGTPKPGGCANMTPSSLTKCAVQAAAGNITVCQVGAQCIGAWCLLSNLSPGANYRLAVEATSVDGTPTEGWGQHGYELQVCSGTSGYAPGQNLASLSCSGGGTVSALYTMDMAFQFPGTNITNTIPLAYIPPSYAGRTVEFDIFNPGNGPYQDTNTVQIVPPSSWPTCTGVAGPTCIQITYGNVTSSSSWVRTSGSPTIVNTSNSGDSIYTGMWIKTYVSLPTNYNPTSTAAGLWNLVYSTSSGKIENTVGVRVRLVRGSPVHLVN